MSDILIGFLLGLCYCILQSFIHSLMVSFYRRRASYDCSVCKVWDCPHKFCIKKR